MQDKSRSMDTRRLLVLMAGQIDVLRRQSEAQPAEGLHARLARSFLRSLRTTYLLLASGLDPRREPVGGFVLQIDASGEPVLRHGRLPVPVDGTALYRRLREAGIDLHGLQAVVVEHDLVRQAVVAGLQALGDEQARLARERGRISAELRDALPPARERLLLELHRLHALTSELWTRKIELTAASLAADEAA